MNKKYIILFVFIFGIIITFPSLIPSYNVDGYCNLQSGFTEYSKIFFSAGRFISGLSYVLFGMLRVSFEFVSILSIILSNLFLTLSVYIFYDAIISKKNFTLYQKVLILLGSWLIFYNPFTAELFVFEESFSMCLGILLVTIAAKLINKDSKKSLFISFLLLFLATGSYQGMLCLFIPLAIIIHFNQDFKFKDIFIFLFKCILVYIAAYISSYLLTSIISGLINNQAGKIGHINLKYNFMVLYESAKKLLTYFSDYINPKVFYFIFIVTILSIFVFTIKNVKMYYKVYIYIILLLIGNIIVNICPYLFMNSANVYICARMCVGLTSIIGMLIVLSSKINVNYTLFYIVMIFISIVFVIVNAFNYFSLSKIGYDRFVQDKKYAENIQKEIFKYEEKSGKKIKKIYFHRDVNPIFKYSSRGTAYTATILGNNWSFTCGINGINKKSYIIEVMDEQDYLNYFKDKDYNKFNNKQLVFKNNTLYLLIY